MGRPKAVHFFLFGWSAHSLHGRVVALLFYASEEAGRVGKIHLGVVELEADIEVVAEAVTRVATPNDKRVVENAAIHTTTKFQHGVDGYLVELHQFFAHG